MTTAKQAHPKPRSLATKGCEYTILVRRSQIHSGTVESEFENNGWVTVESHYYFLEALDRKDIHVAKGLDVCLQLARGDKASRPVLRFYDGVTS